MLAQSTEPGVPPPPGGPQSVPLGPSLHVNLCVLLSTYKLKSAGVVRFGGEEISVPVSGFGPKSTGTLKLFSELVSRSFQFVLSGSEFMYWLIEFCAPFANPP